MKYQVIIHIDLLPLVLEIYKKTGGYFEVIPNKDNAITVISDNEKFLYHDDFKGVKKATPITPVQDNSEIIRKEIINVLRELYEEPTEIKTVSGPVAIPSVDVCGIKLQRSKVTEKKTFDFKLKKPRSKWELIKILQEEFDKFPDDTEFTSFSVLGIGVGRSHYL